MHLAPLRLPPEYLDYLRRAASSQGRDPLGIWMPRNHARLRLIALLSGAILAVFGGLALSAVRYEGDFVLPGLLLPLAAGLLSWWYFARRNMAPLAEIGTAEFCDGATWWIIGPDTLQAVDLSEAFTVQIVQRRSSRSFVTRTYLEVHAANSTDPLILSREFTHDRGEGAPASFIANCAAVREPLRLLPQKDPRRLLLKDPDAIAHLALGGPAPGNSTTPSPRPVAYPDPSAAPRLPITGRPAFRATVVAIAVFAGLALGGPPVLQAVRTRHAERAAREQEQRALDSARAGTADGLNAARAFLKNYPKSPARAEIAARYDALALAQARAATTSAAATAYLADPFAGAARNEVEALLDERLFNESADHSVTTLRAYLREPRAQRHRAQVRAAYDAAVFAGAIAAPTALHWRQYLEDPDCGERREEALGRLDEALFREAASATERTASLQPLIQFLKEYPGSAYAAEARGILHRYGYRSRTGP